MKSINPRYITNLTKNITLSYIEDINKTPTLVDMGSWFSKNIKDIKNISTLDKLPEDKRKIFF